MMKGKEQRKLSYYMQPNLLSLFLKHKFKKQNKVETSIYNFELIAILRNSSRTLIGIQLQPLLE